MEFDAAFELVSIGSGFYGEGTMNINGDSTGFVGNGEVHAILRFNGLFDAIGWTDSNETHRASTVGLTTLGLTLTPAIAEPGTWVLMLAGLGLVWTAFRRRQAFTVEGAAA